MHTRHPVMSDAHFVLLDLKELRHGKTETDLVHSALGLHLATVVPVSPYPESGIAHPDYTRHRNRVSRNRRWLQMGSSANGPAESLATDIGTSCNSTNARCAVWHSDAHSAKSDNSC